MRKTRVRQLVDSFLEGRSHASLARDLGISTAYLSQIVNGQRRPSLRVAVKFEQLTGIPVEEFVTRHRRAA